MHYKAYAKVNIFLKIVGTRGNYHELVSRFMIVPSLFDTLSFVPKKSKEAFELVGDFNCALEHNTLYRTFMVLKSHGFAKEVERVMGMYALQVSKNIPTGSGLGGGSSDSATFLKMLNDVGNLGLSLEEMMKLGSEVGADVPFFASGYESANVSGIGEIVEKYDEEVLNIEVITPKIKCNTGEIFKIFREKFYKTINTEDIKKLFNTKSKDILLTYKIEEANDLYLAASTVYEELKEFAKDNWFFSGSGSSFFRIIEDVK